MEKETKDQNNNTSNKRNIKFVDLPRYYTYTDKRNDSYTTFKEIEDLIKEAQKYVDDEGKYAYRSYNEILDNPIFSSRYAKNDKNSVKSWRDVNFPRDIIYAILIKAMPENEKMKYITSRSRNYRTGELEEPDENSYVYYDSTGHELNYNEGLYLLNKYPGLKMVALGLNNKDIVRDFLTYKDPRDKIEQDVKFGQNGRYISSYERYMENADEHPKLIISNPLSTKESIHPIRIANQSEDSQDIHTTNSVNYNTGVLGGGQPGSFNIKPLFLNVPFFEDSNYSNVPTNYNYSYSENGLPFLIPNMRGYYTIASLKSPFDVNYSDYDWSDLDNEEDKRPPRYQDINYLHLLLPEMFSDLRKRLFQKDPNEREIQVHYAADGGQLEQRSEPTLLLKAMMSADPELYALNEGFDKHDADDLYLEMMKELVEPLGIKHTFTNKNNKEDDNRHRITIRKFDDGGAMVIDKNGEFVNNQSWSSYKDWKALKNIDYEVVPDTTFTRDKTKQGDIDVFSAENSGNYYDFDKNTKLYRYYKLNPIPGKDVILYNPNTNDEQDVRLDALHLMPKLDNTYNTLNLLYRETAKNGDPGYWAKLYYKQDVEEKGKDNIDSEEQYFNNEADGLLRNMFIEGSPEYIESKRYRSDKDNLIRENEYLMPYINNILLYLESGQRPTWIQTRDDNGNILTSRLLPEIYVDENHSWYPNGGKINKFETGGNTTQIEENVYSPFTINGITYGIIPNLIADASKGISDLEGNDVVGKPVYVKYNSLKKKWENTTMTKDAANIRVYENRPKEAGIVLAISEDGKTLYGTLPELTVGSIDNKDSLPATYDEKAKSAGAYDPYNNPSISAQLNNLFNSDPVIKELRRRILDSHLKLYNASNFLNTIIPMHLISPTNYVGAIGEAARGNANFFLNALSGHNRGLFSLSDDLYNWSTEHPYISTGINIIGDMALGAAAAKPFIDWRNPNSLWSLNIRTSFANDKIPFAYILKDSDNIMPYIKGTYATLKGKRIPLENRLQKAIDRSGVFDSDLFGEIPRALPNETYQLYLKRTGLPHSTEIERWYNRLGMWNLYLGVGDESHNLNMSINNRSENYIRKSDGTYDINLTKEEEANFLTPKGNSKVGDDYRYITYDYDIGNHANVGALLAYDDGKLVSVLNDPFDLHPVQAITKHLPKSFKWLEKYIPSPEVSSILPAGAEPVTFKHIIPIEENGFTGFVWDNGLIISPILREEAKDIINNGSFLTTDIPTITKATR